MENRPGNKTRPGMVVAEIGLAVSLASLVLNPGSQTTVARRTTLPVGFKPYHQEEEKPGLDLPILYTRLCESVHFFSEIVKENSAPKWIILRFESGHPARTITAGSQFWRGPRAVAGPGHPPKSRIPLLRVPQQYCCLSRFLRGVRSPGPERG